MKLWLKIIIIIAVLSLVGGGIFGIVKLVDQGKFDTKKISNLAYGIGGLDSHGKYVATKESIYTKDAFECQGLDITLDFDSTVTYKVFFYTEKCNFLLSTESQSGSYSTVPANAKYARIVITPQEDDSVNVFEVIKYQRQVNVKVNRNQKFVHTNLYEIDSNMIGKHYSGSLASIDNWSSGFGESKLISIGNVIEYRVGILTSELSSTDYKVLFFNSSGHQDLDVAVSGLDGVQSGDFTWFIVSVPAGADKMCIHGKLPTASEIIVDVYEA